MASLVPTIETKGFQNWLRGALAVLFAKQGLERFVIDELTLFQRDILTSIFKNNNIPAGSVCTTCTTENVLHCPTINFCTRRGHQCNIHDLTVPDKTDKPCPNRICQDVKDCIRREHIYNRPSWKNTDAKRWCSDVIEIAKCYMPPDGYRHVRSIEDTDFNGTLAVILNNKRFKCKMADPLDRPDNVCYEARDVCRSIRHSAELTISDTDLVKYIDSLICLLSDPAYLAADRNAKEAVEKLDQLKSKTLTVTTADIITVLDSALKDITEKKRDDALQYISKEKRKAFDELEVKKTKATHQFLGNVKASLTKMQKVTTSKLDKIIEAQQSALDTIQTITEKGKRELTAKSTEEKQTIKEEVGRAKDELKNEAEKEKHDFMSLIKREKKGINDEKGKGIDEIKNVTGKEKQEFKSFSKMEKQGFKHEIGEEIDKFKLVAKKETRDLESLGDRKRQIIKDETGEAIDKIKRVTEKGRQELTALREKKLIKDESGKDTVSCFPQPLFPEMNNTTERRKKLEKGLREDLLTYYRQCYNSIPITPHVEENDVELIDFYVQPPLTATDIEKTSAAPTRTAVHSYHDLFLGADGKPYKNIYITAKAGIGKTSFVKKICMTWCQAHGPHEAQKLKFKPDDVDVMKRFEFLFVISLRDSNTSICDIDTMICAQVIGSLAGPQNSEHFVKDILKHSTCLIVLDGLDEWSHPRNCSRGCPNVHEIHIPHRPARERCSVLTTTRPWKLDAARLRTNQKDRHIEINELDESSSDQLISNVLTVLNKKSKQNQPKTIMGFRAATYSTKIETIRYIPYILLQMICLWFDGKSVGKSKCEIYSNVVDHTFTRGLMKFREEQFSSLGSREPPVNYSVIPLCLRSKRYCTLFYNVLLRLGQIAFQTLFDVKEESNLVFNKTVILKSISEQVLAFCLRMGFISQNKAYGPVSVRQSTFSFQDQSIQEYFAALYIQSESDNEDIQQIVYKKCKTLALVLEMSVFLFLGGLKPETCEKILQSLQHVISTDQIIRYYRNTVVCYDFCIKKEYLNTIRDLQSMQTDIVHEILNNDLKYVPQFLEDILLDRTIDKNIYPLLKLLIEKNKTDIKSLHIKECQNTEEFTGILDTLELRNVQSLQKLEMMVLPRQQDLLRLLSGSAHTLTCLCLHFVELKNRSYYPAYANITTENIRTLFSMDLLLSLSLCAVCLPHIDIDALLSFITRRTTMTEISLRGIKFTDHRGRCIGICLDLSKHQKLETLHLTDMIITKLQVNTPSLKTCLAGNLPAEVYSSLLIGLQYATGLREVSFGGVLHEGLLEHIKETLPKLENLKVLLIYKFNLRNQSLIVPTEMKCIDEVRIYKVTMTSAALTKCIRSIDLLPQSVCITLHECTVIQQGEYEQIKDGIRASPLYKVTSDGLNKLKANYFVYHSAGQNL